MALLLGANVWVFRASSGPFVAPARAYVDAGTVTGTEPSTVHFALCVDVEIF